MEDIQGATEEGEWSDLYRSVKKPLIREPGTKAEETEAVLERRRRQSLEVEKRQVDTERY